MQCFASKYCIVVRGLFVPGCFNLRSPDSIFHEDFKNVLKYFVGIMVEQLGPVGLKDSEIQYGSTNAGQENSDRLIGSDVQLAGTHSFRQI